MFINLTGIELENIHEDDELLEQDSQILAEAIGDADRVDEVASILLAYEPHEIALDVDEDYFHELQARMDGVILTLGVPHEYLGL